MSASLRKPAHALAALISWACLPIALPVGAVENSAVFGYVEATFPTLFFASPGLSGEYRYYPGSKSFLMIDASGMINVILPSGAQQVIAVGPVAAFAGAIEAWSAVLPKDDCKGYAPLETFSVSPYTVVETWSDSVYTYKASVNHPYGLAEYIGLKVPDVFGTCNGVFPPAQTVKGPVEPGTAENNFHQSQWTATADNGVITMTRDYASTRPPVGSWQGVNVTSFSSVGRVTVVYSVKSGMLTVKETGGQDVKFNALTAPFAAFSNASVKAADFFVTWPVTVVSRPGVPEAVSAAWGSTPGTVAIVSFSAPVKDGGRAIAGYTVTAFPGGATTSGTASPITVNGLSNGTDYTFTVTAYNTVLGHAGGTSEPSAPSNLLTIAKPSR